MRVKLLTFRYSSSLGGFDDTALSEFIRDKEVIAFREHFYAVNEVPHISCVIHYQDAVVPVAALRAESQRTPSPNTTATLRPTQGEARSSKEVPEAAEDLDTNERALFNHLREWRARTARGEGVPPYVLFTNRQLAAIVRARPDSPTALAAIEGVGKGKLERFGRGLLTALHGAPRTATQASARETPDLAQPPASEAEAGGTDDTAPPPEVAPSDTPAAAPTAEAHP